MVALGVVTASASAEKFDHKKLAEQARIAFILPGYQGFADKIANLGAMTQSLCIEPSPSRLANAQSAFAQAIASWGRIEIIAFGPVAEQNRMERIFFWPDRKSIGRRQVQRLIRDQSEDVTDPDALSNKSVAVQGLMALELLLYGRDATGLGKAQPQNHRCRFALAITTNLSRIADDVVKAWRSHGAFAKLWATPGALNPRYLNSEETTLELIKMFDQAMEMARDQRIAPPIGLAANRRKTRPVLWRSGLGMVLIHANLVGARDLLFSAGLAEAYIKSQGQSDESVSAIASMASEFKLLLRATERLAQTAKPFALPDIKQRLVAVGFPVKNIRSQAVARIKGAAGLSIGFNASDGD